MEVNTPWGLAETTSASYKLGRNHGLSVGAITGGVGANGTAQPTLEDIFARGGVVGRIEGIKSITKQFVLNKNSNGEITTDMFVDWVYDTLKEVNIDYPLTKVKNLSIPTYYHYYDHSWHKTASTAHYYGVKIQLENGCSVGWMGWISDDKYQNNDFTFKNGGWGDNQWGANYVVVYFHHDGTAAIGYGGCLADYSNREAITTYLIYYPFKSPFLSFFGNNSQYTNAMVWKYCSQYYETGYARVYTGEENILGDTNTEVTTNIEKYSLNVTNKTLASSKPIFSGFFPKDGTDTFNTTDVAGYDKGVMWLSNSKDTTFKKYIDTAGMLLVCPSSSDYKVAKVTLFNDDGQYFYVYNYGGTFQIINRGSFGEGANIDQIAVATAITEEG